MYLPNASRAARLLLLALAIVPALLAADGRFYRWTDSKGVVHYGDRPVESAQEVSVKVPSAVAPGKSNAATAAAECQRLTEQAASYKAAAAITETNSLGQTREYSGAEKQKLVEDSEQRAAKACGKP